MKKFLSRERIPNVFATPPLGPRDDFRNPWVRVSHHLLPLSEWWECRHSDTVKLVGVVGRFSVGMVRRFQNGEVSPFRQLEVNVGVVGCRNGERTPCYLQG